MKAVLFDLGRTLEENNRLREGALELLEALPAMPGITLALVSDFVIAAAPEQIPAIRRQ